MTESKPMSLAEALPLEMARVRDEVLPHYTPAVNGQFAATMMRADLDLAAKALAENDIAGMVTALENLRGYDV